jgi:hypothetical protein
MLFAKLKAIYGTEWSRRFAGEQDIELAMEAWAEGLHGMSGEQIFAALDACRRAHRWAPSSPAEFRERAGVSVSAPYHRAFQRALPPPPANRAVVRREMALIKARLGLFVRPSRWACLNAMVPRV